MKQPKMFLINSFKKKTQPHKKTIFSNFSQSCASATNNNFMQTGLFAQTCYRTRYRDFSKNKYGWLLVFFVIPKITKNKSTKNICPRFNK